MMKYQLNINLENFNLNHAGTKAVTDCEKILTAKNYKSISLSFNKSPYFLGFSLIKLASQLLTWALLIKPGSLIVTQYPLIGVNRFFRFYIQILKIKKCRIVCIIHDLNSLRYQQSSVQVRKEIENLNAYDTVITHNNIMSNWLKSNRLSTRTIPIQIFDYLYQDENTHNRLKAFSINNKEIVFAGNLNRGKFIDKLFQVKALNFCLYGPINNSKKVTSQTNVIWKGTYEPEVLLTKLEGIFGLIWDGDSITNCEGEYGNYINYNNPHKISLYIAAGLPIIIPVKAALSAFVKSNNIGICVNSLHDIHQTINKVSVEEYYKMLNNITILKQQLKQGAFFLASLNCIEEAYNNVSTKTTIPNLEVNKRSDEKANI